jgi:hypothetical protein
MPHPCEFLARGHGVARSGIERVLKPEPPHRGDSNTRVGVRVGRGVGVGVDRVAVADGDGVARGSGVDVGRTRGVAVGLARGDGTGVTDGGVHVIAAVRAASPAVESEMSCGMPGTVSELTRGDPESVRSRR